MKVEHGCEAHAHHRRKVWMAMMASMLLIACDASESSMVSSADISILDSSSLDASEMLDLALEPPIDQRLPDVSVSDTSTARLDGAVTPDAMIQIDAEIMNDVGTVMDAGISTDALVETTDVFVPEPPTREGQIAQIIEDFGLDDMRIRFPESDIEFQESTHIGTVDFTLALTQAINSFLTDGTDVESPRSLAADVREGPCLDDDLTERVRCFLNRDTAILELYGSEGFAPENREPIAENWIFVLRAESLSDHIQWAIIDRTGAQAPYNYGFN